MKVAYILNTTKMGGGNISFINMIEKLHQKGVEIHIIHPDKKIDPIFYSLTKDFVTQYYFCKMRPRIIEIYNHSLIYKAKCVAKRLIFRFEVFNLIRILKLISPQLVHTNVGVIHSGYFACKILNIPHLWHLRVYQDKDFDWSIIPSKQNFISYLKNTNVICITKDICASFNLDNYKNAEVIYNGCFSVNDCIYTQAKQKYFLCCSRLSPEKGHDIVIRAFSQFYKDHSDYKLVIAGFGNQDYVDYLTNLAKQLKCINAISFLGFQKNVRPLLDKAKALIVASKFEGFGRMTAEAAFRGCIVIGRNTGGTKEIIDKTGGVFFDGTVQDLINKMYSVSKLSTEDYSKISLKALEVAKNQFSIEQNAENVYQTYKRILKNP